MKKILIVVDMQNDFIDGSLGTPEAEETVEYVKQKILSYQKDCVIATKDTHGEDYPYTHEGKLLPVGHCVRGTEGWDIHPELRPCLEGAKIYEKSTFGCLDMVKDLKELSEKEDISIELVGLCTDICVVSNALLLRAFLPEADISVDSKGCAGTTPEAHEASLKTMRSCHIAVI